MKKENTYKKPQLNSGIQSLGEGLPQYRIYFEPHNIVQREYANSTINEGQETTIDKISRHIEKYDQVWEALA